MDRNAVKLPTRSRTFRLDQARRVQKRFFPQFSPPSDTHISEWLEGSPDEAYNRLAKILRCTSGEADFESTDGVPTGQDQE
jgi:hypothetical protein